MENFYRVATRAVLRNGKIEYTGEQLMLALLLHSAGKSGRDSAEQDYVARLLDDPNQEKR